jgi:hypothetical protein
MPKISGQNRGQAARNVCAGLWDINRSATATAHTPASAGYNRLVLSRQTHYESPLFPRPNKAGLQWLHTSFTHFPQDQ